VPTIRCSPCERLVFCDWGHLLTRTKPWIVNIFQSIKDFTFTRVSKHFPWPLEKLVYSLSPRGLYEARKEEFAFASRRARERMLQGSTDRADFMSYILKYNDEKGYGSL